MKSFHYSANVSCMIWIPSGSPRGSKLYRTGVYILSRCGLNGTRFQLNYDKENYEHKDALILISSPEPKDHR